MATGITKIGLLARTLSDFRSPDGPPLAVATGTRD
jgi:hypothetical protein